MEVRHMSKAKRKKRSIPLEQRPLEILQRQLGDEVHRLLLKGEKAQMPGFKASRSFWAKGKRAQKLLREGTEDEARKVLASQLKQLRREQVIFLLIDARRVLASMLAQANEPGRLRNKFNQDHLDTVRQLIVEFERDLFVALNRVIECSVSYKRAFELLEWMNRTESTVVDDYFVDPDSDLWK
jgi:hypothetical protein